MESVIVEVKPLNGRERTKLKKIMRSRHGAVKMILEATKLHRPRVYEAARGEKVSLQTLNAIRKFLNAQKVA